MYTNNNRLNHTLFIVNYISSSLFLILTIIIWMYYTLTWEGRGFYVFARGVIFFHISLILTVTCMFLTYRFYKKIKIEEKK